MKPFTAILIVFAVGLTSIILFLPEIFKVLEDGVNAHYTGSDLTLRLSGVLVNMIASSVAVADFIEFEKN